MPHTCKNKLFFFKLDLLLNGDCLKVLIVLNILIFPHHHGFLIILDIFFLAGLFFWIDSPCLDYSTALSSLGLVRNRTFHLRSPGMYMNIFLNILRFIVGVGPAKVGLGRRTPSDPYLRCLSDYFYYFP